MRLRLLIAALATVALVVVVIVVVVTRDSEPAAEPNIRRDPPAAPAPTSSLPPQTGEPIAGRQVWDETGCGSCHTLAAAGSTGTIGPPLDGRRASYARVLEQVSEGGGGMPAYAGVLSDAEIQDIVAFVLEAIAAPR